MKEFLENAWQKAINVDEKVVSYKLPNTLKKGNYNSGKLVSTKKYGKQKGWTFTENWKPSDGKRTRENYTNVPMLINDGIEKILKFKFKGDAAGIAIAAGSDAGIIACKVDGKPWVKYDLYPKWSAGLHLPWYKTLAAGLDNGKHTLKIKVLKGKNPLSEGNACRI